MRLPSSQAPVLKVVRLRPEADVPLPQYQTPGAAGLDLCAAVGARIAPGRWAKVPTGIAVELPPGHAGLVFARSGLAMRKGLGMVNGVGVIDGDYRGEVHATIVNHGEESQTVEAGERVAQILVVPVATVKVVEVASIDELSRTERGAGGFGSTGTR